MDLLWPGFLYGLVLIPLLLIAYIWVLRRRRRYAVRYSSLAVVREALPRYSRWRRHVPFALFLVALASLIVALARPLAVVTVPTDQVAILLVIDVSRSMRFNDILPSRLDAAEAAATSFIQHQNSQTQIGLVAFSNVADLVQPPTTDQNALEAAVESLTTGRSTAVGNGILKALDAISEIDPNVAPSVIDGSAGVAPTPVPKGDFAPDIIVVLTDGVSNSGPDPIDAAQEAADRGVRVYTIGFGTAQGPSFGGFGGGGGYSGGGGFPGGGGYGGGGGFPGGGGGGGGFGGFRRGIDDVALKQIAEMTGAQYYPAASADELQNVFQNLPTYLISKHETTEISVAFAAIGTLLAALAVSLSVRWHPLP